MATKKTNKKHAKKKQKNNVLKQRIKHSANKTCFLTLLDTTM